MAPYHVVMVHFPIALWMTATLVIIFRALSDGPTAKLFDRALVPLLSVGLISGVVAFAIGLMVWPWETISASAIGRNHVLTASWTVAYWAVILYVRWGRGERVWEGLSRWVKAGLAALGCGLLGITGTLGGHLVGIYTDVSTGLRKIGWDVYTTFYVPDSTLIALAGLSILLVGVGVWAKAAHRSLTQNV
jgi:hypothetical protein